VRYPGFDRSRESFCSRRLSATKTSRSFTRSTRLRFISILNFAPMRRHGLDASSVDAIRDRLLRCAFIADTFAARQRMCIEMNCWSEMVSTCCTGYRLRRRAFKHVGFDSDRHRPGSVQRGYAQRDRRFNRETGEGCRMSARNYCGACSLKKRVRRFLAGDASAFLRVLRTGEYTSTSRSEICWTSPMKAEPIQVLIPLEPSADGAPSAVSLRRQFCAVTRRKHSGGMSLRGKHHAACRKLWQ
jgi:hypothetical protein